MHVMVMKLLESNRPMRKFAFLLGVRFVCASALFVLFSCESQPAGGESTQKDNLSATQNQNIDTLSVETAVNPTALTDIFTYHKQFKVNDTITFDVLGWGTESKGSYLVLRSDKLSNRYFSISGQREGRIINSFVTDMDADLQIEVIIVTQENATKKGNIYSHEIDSLNKQTDIILPELTTELKRNYAGSDTFYLNQNKLIRQFQLTSGQNNSKGQNASQRQIDYVFKNNTFILSGNSEK